MADQTVARKVLWPTDNKIVLRACFLHVGQGSSILLLVRKESDYKAILVDSNLDEKAGGIDLTAMLKDLLPDGTMHAFVNTHPHDDHLKGLKEIKAALTIENVWHSGHVPSKKFGTYHPDLKALIKDVEEREGEVKEISGSRTSEALGDTEVYFLAPAEYVKDEVNEEEADARYRRIHENCAVLRFGKKVDDSQSWLLVTGDADLCAFRDHITKYHKKRMPAVVLDASHHGSRSFFKDKEEDDPYMDALNEIDPTYVVVSAPTQEESRHDHPHDDAMKIYEDYVGKGKVFHTGKEKESFIFDIYEDGSSKKPRSDEGELAKEYGLGQSKDAKEEARKASGPFTAPKDPAEGNPRKYA